MVEQQKFGGNWTKEKLDILERYLDAYTTALKKKPFKLAYIDAFAGSGGYFTTDYNGFREFHKGSVRIALGTKNKEFDSLVFVETNQNSFQSLQQVKEEYRNRRITLVNEDANTYLEGLNNNWTRRRGVLFLDPFGTQVAWKTIQKIASLKALDLWILFPVSAISRILPVRQEPDDISEQWAKRLTIIYGSEDWRKLYKLQPYMDLFDGSVVTRETGTAGLIKIYKQQLRNCFEERFLEESKPLKNSTGATLFEFIFCAGHPNGAPLAKKIAKHLVERL